MGVARGGLGSPAAFVAIVTHRRSSMSERTAPPLSTPSQPKIPYVPGLEGVPAAKSSICWIDGDQGILEYRGYAIETLAEKSTFEETSHMLLWGKLPPRGDLEKF